MSNFSTVYRMLPWWSVPTTGAVCAIALAGLVPGLEGQSIASLVLLGAMFATIKKYQRRKEDAVLRILHMSDPANKTGFRMMNLNLGHVGVSALLVVVAAIVFSALLGPLGAMVPALVLIVRNRMSAPTQASTKQDAMPMTRMSPMAHAV